MSYRKSNTVATRDSGSGANDARRSLTYLRLGARRNTGRGEEGVPSTRKAAHPDKNPAPNAEDLFKRVQEAYEFISTTEEQEQTRERVAREYRDRATSEARARAAREWAERETRQKQERARAEKEARERADRELGKPRKKLRKKLKLGKNGNDSETRLSPEWTDALVVAFSYQ